MKQSRAVRLPLTRPLPRPVPQAEKLKKEMEEMRESLFSENASLKEERSQMHKQLDELKSAVAQRDGTITALITQVRTRSSRGSVYPVFCDA